MRFGEVRGVIRGLNLERLLNDARRRGLRFREVRRLDARAVRVRCGQADYAALRQMALDKGYEAEEGKPAGWARADAWCRARWGLMLGLAMGAALGVFALRFVWTVDVVNAGAYEADARQALAELGIRPGMLRRDVDLSALREALEWRWPRVQWVRTEWAGTALRLTLEEGAPPPEVETAGRIGDVVAAEDGLLLRLTVYAGTAQAKEGDFVRAGQVLIRGEERGKDDSVLPVKARGDCEARVWITARSRLPLSEEERIPTGREASRWGLKTPFLSFFVGGEAEYLCWDGETKEIPLIGAWLPVTMLRETRAEVCLAPRARDPAKVTEEGKTAALALLAQALAGHETVDKWINFSMIEGDTILTEAAAEVRRDIGRFVPRE